MYAKKIFIAILFFYSATTTLAQKEGRDFTDIDADVKKLGRLDSLPMGTIAYNITLDLKNAKNMELGSKSCTEVLLTRKATAAGYATLFQDMCSSAGIRCLTINGYVKNDVDQIGDTKTEINHVWAIVQLGQSPDAWYFVDPCKGAGYSDADYKTFTPKFNPDYFFANLTIFNWQHFPDNTAWYIGPRVKNKKDFFDLPIVEAAAYELGLKKMGQMAGKLKIKVKERLPFSFQLSSNAQVDKVTLEMGEGKRKVKKEIDFTFNGSTLVFNHKFEEEDTFPVTIYVNDKPLTRYMIEIE
jgi:transglutaminase/protease-like cytokinesis protein 3